MIEDKINLLKEKYNSIPERHHPKIRRVFLILLVFLAVGGTALSYKITDGGDVGARTSVSLFSALKDIVGIGEKKLKGEEQDRVNIMLFGIGGAGHDGPELTDTVVFASWRPSTNEIGMLSLPRDLVVYVPGYDWRKINNINAFGEVDSPGEGPKLASTIIGETLEQDIHYYVKADFDGFAKIIDDIGGIDIFVDNSFADEQYPTDDYKVRTISFEQGWQHMNGETALKFVRSRHGNNGEGSDFSRAARQQKILVSLKDKIFSARTLLNPGKVSRIFNSLSDNIKTNLSVWEIMRLAEIARSIEEPKIAMQVLDDSPSGALYSTIINGAYVLFPKNDDWRKIKRIAANILPSNEEEKNIAKNEPAPAKIEIKNGTLITGLALNTSQLLEEEGFEVIKIGNAPERDYKDTIIFDLSNGARSNDLNALREFLSADVTIEKNLVLTDEEIAEAKSANIDFLIILGEENKNFASI